MKHIFKSIFAITLLLGLGSSSVIPVDPSEILDDTSTRMNVTQLLGRNSCPHRFMSPGYGEYCYYFSTIEDTRLNWVQAQLQCKIMHKDATLVRPYTESINAFIKGTIVEIAKGDGEETDYWMDLNMLHIKQDGDDRPGWSDVGFQFTDGVAPTYTDWYEHQPDFLDIQHCGQYYHPFQYQWDDMFCGTEQRYICQVPVHQ